MKLQYAPSALADIEFIGDHIARESAHAAERVVAAIHAKCVAIAAAPLLYPTQDQFPTYRRGLARPYGIWFRIESDTVRIERVLHGARDLASILGSRS